MANATFGSNDNNVQQSWTKISERRGREPTNFIELFEILRFNKQFLENCVFDGQFYQAGEWLQIHTRQSKISLAMASVASVISTPARPQKAFLGMTTLQH